MNTEQERADFEAFASQHGLCVTEDGDLYRSHVVAWMWKAWQARAALQSQEPKDNDLMLSAVLRMPFEMAMANHLSQMQFYQRAQQALSELEALQSQDREDAGAWYDRFMELSRDLVVANRALVREPTTAHQKLAAEAAVALQVHARRRVEGEGG